MTPKMPVGEIVGCVWLFISGCQPCDKVPVWPGRTLAIASVSARLGSRALAALRLALLIKDNDRFSFHSSGLLRCSTKLCVVKSISRKF